MTFVKNQFGRPIVRAVSIVASGTILAQIIAFIVMPVVTRLYGPEAMGAFSVYMSITGMLTIAIWLSYPIALVLPKDDNEAITILCLSLGLALIATALSYILIRLIGDDIWVAMGAQHIVEYKYTVPIAALLAGLHAVFLQWLLRNQQFRHYAIAGLLAAIASGIIKIGFGYFEPATGVLIFASIVGPLIGALLVVALLRGTVIARPFLFCIRWNKIKFVAKKYYDFPFLRTPQDLINAFSQNLPILILASYASVRDAGLYGIAVALLGVPAGLIGGSVMAVYYPKISRAIIEGENCQKSIVKATLVMAGIGAIPFLALMYGGSNLFGTLFGEEWREAGVYAQYIAPWIFFQFINKPAVAAIPALKLQGGLLVYELASTSSKILALWLGVVIFKDKYFAVGLFSMFGVVAYIWLIIWVVLRSAPVRKADLAVTARRNA